MDEFRILEVPIVLGKRLFGEGSPHRALKLVDSAVKPGSFALAEPTATELDRRKKLAREG